MITPDLSSNAVDVFVPVLEEQAQQMLDEPEVYKSYLSDRILGEKAFAAKYRDNPGDRWKFASGDYRDPYEGRPGDPNWRIDAPLSGAELAWAGQIDDRLSQKEGSSKPVIAVEFGAGFAVSLIRLGAQERYRRAIKRGDLLLAATNLGYLPPEEADANGYTGIAQGLSRRNYEDYDGHMRPAELSFLEKHQHNVRFLDANALELFDANLTNPDGELVPLKGNVDMITENLALMHTHVPEIALGVFAVLLDQGGTMNLNLKFPNGMQGIYEEFAAPDGRTIAIDREYNRQREFGYQVGRAALTQQFGMEFVHDSLFEPLELRKHL